MLWRLFGGSPEALGRPRSSAETCETDPPAILTEGLIKHYGDVRALTELDLEVRPGRRW